MIWAWIYAAIFLAALVALVFWVIPYCWRELRELGTRGDHAAPVKRAVVADATVPVLTTAGSPPWGALLPAPLPPMCDTPWCWQWAGHDGECRHLADPEWKAHTQAPGAARLLAEGATPGHTTASGQDLVPGAGPSKTPPVTTATCRGACIPPKVDSPAPEAPVAAAINPPDEPPPPVTPPASITAYASALEAAERERQAVEAAALAEAQAWQQELRAEAEATSPWVERVPLAVAMGFSDDTLMRIDTRKLMADVEEYGRQLAERGMAS